MKYNPKYIKIIPNSIDFESGAPNEVLLDGSVFTQYYYITQLPAKFQAKYWTKDLIDLYSEPEKGIEISIHFVIDRGDVGKLKQNIEKETDGMVSKVEESNKKGKYVQAAAKTDSFVENVEIAKKMVSGDLSVAKSTICLRISGQTSRAVEDTYKKIKATYGFKMEKVFVYDKIPMWEHESFNFNKNVFFEHDTIIDTKVVSHALTNKNKIVMDTSINSSFLGFDMDTEMPIWIDRHRRTLTRTNSNSVILGRTGSGKTFFVHKMVRGNYASGHKSVVFDPKGDLHVTFLNPKFFNQDRVFLLTKEDTINPFEVVSSNYRDVSNEDLRLEQIDKLLIFFKVLLNVEGSLITATNQHNIKNVIESFYTDEVFMKAQRNDTAPTSRDFLTHFARIVEKKNFNNLSGSNLDDEAVKSLNIIFQNLKSIFETHKDMWGKRSKLKLNIEEKDIFLFDLSWLNQKIGNDHIVAAQYYLMTCFAEMLKVDNNVWNIKKDKDGLDIGDRHLDYFIDEGHRLIRPETPQLLNYFVTLSKEARSQRASVNFITQSASEFDKGLDSVGDLLNQNQYWFIFNQNKKEIEIIDKYMNSSEEGTQGLRTNEKKFLEGSVLGQMLFVLDKDETMKVRVVGTKHEMDSMPNDNKNNEAK